MPPSKKFYFVGYLFLERKEKKYNILHNKAIMRAKLGRNLCITIYCVNCDMLHFLSFYIYLYNISQMAPFDQFYLVR